VRWPACSRRGFAGVALQFGRPARRWGGRPV